MTTAASPSQPRRAEVTAAYDLGVDAYVALWSPVILPAAQAVLAALAPDRAARILDVGTGSGALVPSLRAAAADVTVVGLDAFAEMLRRCRSATGITAIRCDALSLPIRDAAVDAVVLAFVLFHLNDPAQAVAEAARVLTCSGRVGTATWARDGPIEADEVWDETLTEAGAPPLRRRSRGFRVQSTARQDCPICTVLVLICIKPMACQNGGTARFANVEAGSLTVTDSKGDEAPDRRFSARRLGDPAAC